MTALRQIGEVWRTDNEALADVSKLEPGEAATLLELLKKAGHTG